MTAPFDIVALGNAITDIIAPLPDSRLRELGIERDAMSLVDAERSAMLTGVAQEAGAGEFPGGSACNTLAGAASLGGRAAFMGKVAGDALGARYREALERDGIPFGTPPLEGGAPTARSVIFVAPDGARSMNTFLGASVEFAPEDVNAETAAAGSILYLEGYLFDRPLAKAAFLEAARHAKAAGRKVALTLSDPFCVDRHKEDFLQLVSDFADIVLANEEEAIRLFGAAEAETAAAALAAKAEVAAVTLGARGSIVLAGGGSERAVLQADPVEAVVDTTGAGDQYAAGLLFGLAKGLPLETCGKLGHLAAAEVIGHYGPRPETSLKAMAEARGLL